MMNTIIWTKASSCLMGALIQVKKYWRQYDGRYCLDAPVAMHLDDNSGIGAFMADRGCDCSYTSKIAWSGQDIESAQKSRKLRIKIRALRLLCGLGRTLSGVDIPVLADCAGRVLEHGVLNDRPRFSVQRHQLGCGALI